jgi:hypothetical protein
MSSTNDGQLTIRCPDPLNLPAVNWSNHAGKRQAVSFQPLESSNFRPVLISEPYSGDVIDEFGEEARRPTSSSLPDSPVRISLVGAGIGRSSILAPVRDRVRA